MLAQEDLLMSGNLSPDAEDGLIKQLQTSRRMSHLVKNLLDLSRMEQQETLYFDQVALDELINRVLDDYVDVIEEKQIRVQTRMAESYLIRGDYEKLFRLFVNLIDNAIRYNLASRGTIEIEMERIKSGVRIDILNSGPNIPEQDIPHLFEQFYRVEKSRTQTLGGSGLGLAIAKKIVSLHNGTITIGNALDQRVRTTLFLPENNYPTHF
jgi:signal transduction histidine kinase